MNVTFPKSLKIFWHISKLSYILFGNKKIAYYISHQKAYFLVGDFHYFCTQDGIKKQQKKTEVLKNFLCLQINYSGKMSIFFPSNLYPTPLTVLI